MIDVNDPVGALLNERHIVICCGSGGVGKTTTAAALALRASDAGRTTIVCTIDPAQRLAQALGLDSLDNTPRPVPAGAYKGRKPKGQLWAMMLNPKRTFDEMVLDLAGAKRAERILANPFYRHVSSTLSGTQEYMAMEKLFELHEEGRWELIVIDTPPTRSALDFLDAPRRLTDFLDSRFLKALLWPTIAAGRSTFRVLNFGARAVLRMATRVTGSELLSDVADFFAAFDGMYGSFKARAARMRELLGAKRTAFVVVASPHAPALREASFFVDRLRAERMPLGAVIVNRTHVAPPVSLDAADAAARAAKAGNASLAASALESYVAWRDVAQHEEQAVAAVLPASVPVWRVPELGEEVHSIAALRAMGGQIVTA